MILATALIEQVAQAFPDARLDVLVQKSREVLLANNPRINQIIVLDKEKKVVSTIGLIKKIRKNKYEKVINIHRHGTSGLLTILSGANETIGFDAHPLSRFFNRRVKHAFNGTHEVERNYKLVQHFIDSPVVNPKLYPTTTDFEKTKQSGPYITISPASVWETKRWPVSKWVELINAMPAEVKVILLGGQSDKSLCLEISQRVTRSVDVKSGVYSFLESAALMQGAVMNYTNDSAPVHMASAMNAPVTAIFCSTIPQFGYGPLSENSIIAEHKGKLACRPCGIHGRKYCPEGHFKCADIDVAPLTPSN